MNSDNYKGISGWLLLLCLNLVIIDPLRNVLGYASSYRNALAKSYMEIPGTQEFYILNLCLLVIVMAFSVYSGIALFKRRYNAVKVAKIYLIFEAGSSVLFGLFPYVAGLPTELADAMMRGLFINALKILGWNIMWYMYLIKSKRVQATYGSIDGS